MHIYKYLYKHCGIQLVSVEISNMRRDENPPHTEWMACNSCLKKFLK